MTEKHSSQRVVVLGASDKPDRYSNRAIKLLREHGHAVVPVHPALAEIDGIPVVSSLSGIEPGPDTLTLYVNPKLSAELSDDILALRPARVIFNPGSESPGLAEKLDAAGIAHEEACTLVLLNTRQF